ncbi:MAG: AbrB/MazE/SpoVT family DNA-binding domain-containing protein [Elusimicrobia bacterium]|nr:AbrB/MazE/SpoVT family DNA-binding domain-containing protein [Elusimicrobiota bacterium]
MTTVIQKWGNSLAVRIPSPLAKDSHIHQGTEVDILLINGKIMLSPKTRTRFSLVQLLKKINKKNLHSEYDWEGSKGRGVW